MPPTCAEAFFMVVEIVERPRDVIRVQMLSFGQRGLGLHAVVFDPWGSRAHQFAQCIVGRWRGRPLVVIQEISDLLHTRLADSAEFPGHWLMAFPAKSGALLVGGLAACVALQDRPAFCFPLDTSGALGHDTSTTIAATTTAHDRPNSTMRHQRQGGGSDSGGKTIDVAPLLAE
jgi:hypothetical protein